MTQPVLRRNTMTMDDAIRNLKAAKRKGGIVEERPSLMTGTLVPNNTPDVIVYCNPFLECNGQLEFQGL